MGFLGVFIAAYDYEPRAEGELCIAEGDILYILDKGDNDGWWKAKKKAGAEDEDEPVGLVPNNYVEEAPIVNHARAIYEYTRQTDEELSFPEESILQVYDASDSDWILVGLDNEYGFVPANYIHLDEADELKQSPSTPAPPALPVRQQSVVACKELKTSSVASPSTPATSLAGPVAGKPGALREDPIFSSPSLPPASPHAQNSEQPASETETDNNEPNSPALPTQPRPKALARMTSPSAQGSPKLEGEFRTPGGFRMYNINEMVSVMGKRKKMSTTLGINLGTGTILIAPERAQDDPPQEWTAEKMTHYSREGKHVFMELVCPSKSIDFHAGAKDTAEEIVVALAELAGAVRAQGLREVILAGSQRRQRKGKVLYDFVAQGDDEVTVAAGDEVLVIDDSKSEEWWQVTSLKNGKAGVVPSSYVEITGSIMSPVVDIHDADHLRGTVEKNRVEEIRLTKEAIKASKMPQQVWPGVSHPKKGSHDVGGEQNDSRQQRDKQENGRNDVANHSKPKSRPDPSKVRTWTDRSGSFSVDAQFLGLKDSKIHLHKMNGVKIAVPIAKMSRDDLEYVEKMTGISLDDDKPLADVKRAKAIDKRAFESGASISKSVKPEYDWFQFFLSCDVPVGLCERYAQAFIKDSMDESVLPDVNATILRTLGLREGDIIKVMRTLDTKFGRERNNQGVDPPSGGLFSGPGGALRNNTRKGRPAPAVQTSDVIDAAAFATAEATASSIRSPTTTSNNPSPHIAARPKEGFDDDAWDVRSNKTASQQNDLLNRAVPQLGVPASSLQAEMTPVLTGSMKDLSLLSGPLQISKTEPPGTNAATSKFEQQEKPSSQQLPGANPSFFSSMSKSTQPQPAAFSSEPLGSTSSPSSLPRHRPLPTSFSATQGSLLPPLPPLPPQRPMSTPQPTQPSVLAAPYLDRQGQVAPQGQNLDDITQARLQQQFSSQYQLLQPAMTGHMSLHPQSMPSFTPGIPCQQQVLHPMMTGATGVTPLSEGSHHTQLLSIQPQPGGYKIQFPSSASTFPPAATHGGNMTNLISPPLEPQRTGLSNQQPQQASGDIGFPQPLQPQKTGPPPPVRFGILPDSRKLTPQQTGRRANLSQATPDNPFGF